MRKYNKNNLIEDSLDITDFKIWVNKILDNERKIEKHKQYHIAEDYENVFDYSLSMGNEERVAEKKHTKETNKGYDKILEQSLERDKEFDAEVVNFGEKGI